MWILLLGIGCRGGGAKAPAAPTETAVKVVTVHPSPTANRLVLTGTVEAEDTAEIRTEASGPVSEVSFQPGDRVSKGDVLIRLHASAQAASVAEAEARLSLAQSQLDRTQSLFDRQNASQSDLDQASAARALAQAQLDEAREQLRKTVVRAPFDGVVGLRQIAPGEVVDSNRVVTRIEAIDRVVVDVGAPERWLPDLQVGLPASVAVDALPGRAFAAEVIYVGPRVDTSTRTAGLRVRVPNSGEELRPGMSAEVTVTTAEVPNAILLPSQAVVTSATGDTVWLVREGTAVSRPVQLGERTADLVRVVDGLADGDQVVVEGLIRLRQGSAVRILDPGGATPGPASASP